MEIKIEEQNQVMIVQLSGNLDGISAPQAEEKITPYIKAASHLVFDMKDCPYVSSAGLRLLLTVAKRLSTQNGTLALAGVSEEVKEVMEMTGFSDFFENYTDVDKAIDSIKAKIA